MTARSVAADISFTRLPGLARDLQACYGFPKVCKVLQPLGVGRTSRLWGD